MMPRWMQLATPILFGAVASYILNTAMLWLK